MYICIRIMIIIAVRGARGLRGGLLRHAWGVCNTYEYYIYIYIMCMYIYIYIYTHTHILYTVCRYIYIYIHIYTLSDIHIMYSYVILIMI